MLATAITSAVGDIWLISGQTAAYATANSSSLFVSVLGKYDYYNANSNCQTGQYAAKSSEFRASGRRADLRIRF